MPKVTFQTKVYHPLVEMGTGNLRLKTNFNEWKSGQNWAIQVLLFVKKIFHLEKFFSLENQADQAWNRQAFDLYNSQF